MRNYIVLDTEATGIIKMSQCRPENMRVYDFGYIVFDGNTHKPIVKRNYIVSEIFFRTELMTSAYYAEKLPMYYKMIENNEVVVDSFRNIRAQFANDCKEYGVKRVHAYNADFDNGACDATVNELSNGYVKEFLPNGVKWFDIWAMAGITVCNTLKYAKFCMDNEYFTTSGNPQTGVETVYRYLFNADFNEAHTALDDAEHEAQILQAIFKRHGKTPNTKHDGWRHAAKQAKKIKKGSK